jgi:3-oxoacyl-(acyl-carrier-protein) synthase
VSTGIAILGVGLVVPSESPVMLEGLEAGQGAPGYMCEIEALGLDLRGALRRVGRSQQMALAAVAEAISDAGRSNTPLETTAVIAGTGLGTVGETVAFLENMFAMKEAQPKPAKFINSVHNSVASAVAMAYRMRGENRTFVHESISFELGLKHALRSIERERCPEALVCGVEEIGPYVVSVGAEYGWWKKDRRPLDPMGPDGGPGTLPGEAAAAFLLAARGESESLPRVRGVSAMPLESSGYRRIEGVEEARILSETLSAWDASLEEIDLLFVGANGDETVDAAYARVVDAVFEMTARSPRVLTYKEKCGEFCTAAAVGAALAMRAVRGGEAHHAVVLGFPQGRYRSTMLVSS